jgi:ABC-2 type transport system permease protein
MNFGIIRALAAKDLSLFFRNKFYALITALGIITYIIIYFVMPSTVDESLKVGLYAPVVPPVFERIPEEGLIIDAVESEEALTSAVTDGKYAAGIALPADILDKLEQGLKPLIKLYFTADAPVEVKDAIEVMVTELAYLQTGQPLAIETSAEILGPDKIGEQVPTRDRMRPLFAILLLMFETMGLASLISEEVEHGTVQALLITPMTVIDLFAAKGIMGISLAFGQAVLFMAIVGGLNSQPLIMLTSLFLGGILVTGAAFLIASLAKDMMSVMAWGIVVVIALSVPAFGILFPGTITGWVKVLPSYYLVDTVHQVASLDAGWSHIWSNLLVLLGFNAAFVVAGIMALRRKLQ